MERRKRSASSAGSAGSASIPACCHTTVRANGRLAGDGASTMSNRTVSATETETAFVPSRLAGRQVPPVVCTLSFPSGHSPRSDVQCWQRAPSNALCRCRDVAGRTTAEFRQSQEASKAMLAILSLPLPPLSALSNRWLALIIIPTGTPLSHAGPTIQLYHIIYP